MGIEIYSNWNGNSNVNNLRPISLVIGLSGKWVLLKQFQMVQNGGTAISQGYPGPWPPWLDQSYLVTDNTVWKWPNSLGLLIVIQEFRFWSIEVPRHQLITSTKWKNSDLHKGAVHMLCHPSPSVHPITIFHPVTILHLNLMNSCITRSQYSHSLKHILSKVEWWPWGANQCESEAEN